MKKTLTLAALLLFPALSQGATLLHHWDFNGGDLSDKVSGLPEWAMTTKGNTERISYVPSEITAGSGDYGDSFTTSGTGAAAWLGATGSLEVAGDFDMTFMAWVKPTASDDNALFGVGGDGQGFKIDIQWAGIRLTTKGVSDFDAIGGGSLDGALNTWSHIAVSVSRTGNNWVVDFFLNGENRASQSVSSGMNIGNLAGFTIGSGNDAGQNMNNNAFDDVKIYGGKMTADEIKVAMGAGAAVPEPTTASLGLLGLTALLLRRRRLA